MSCALAPWFFFNEFWLFFSLSLWYFKLFLAVTGSLEVGEKYSVFSLEGSSHHTGHTGPACNNWNRGGRWRESGGERALTPPEFPKQCRGVRTGCKDRRFPLQQPTDRYSPSRRASRKVSVLCILRILRAAVSWCVCSLALLHSHSNLTLMRSILVAQVVKNLPIMQESWVRSLGWEDPLEKGLATQSSILA